KLGIEISQATVAKYMLRRPRTPSPTWCSFLSNRSTRYRRYRHVHRAVCTFRLRFVMLILAQDRRNMVGFNVTQHPTAAWLSRQVTEACPWDTAHRYLLRDRDASYSEVFSKRVAVMDIAEVVIGPRSPWQNPYVERAIGSIRREYLDHLIVFNE